MARTIAALRIYTRRGDDGSTGLFHGGRVSKDDTGPEAYGTVDEAVSALGAARALADGELADLILEAQRDMFVAAAELATAAKGRSKLQVGVSLVSDVMIDLLEERIDAVVERAGMPDGFVVPGGNPAAAALDVARTVVRRAERRSVSHARVAGLGDSKVVAYLNRMADYLYVLARAAEGTWLPSRTDDGGV